MPEVPTLFCLHALGSSRLSFAPLAASLGGDFETVALDLAGFGDAPASAGTTVAEMADRVIGQIGAHFAGRESGWGRWLLVGHSMGGKVATVVASRTMAGTAPLFGLAGVVLLAASPPSPEPMPADKRAEMLAWVDNGQLDDAAARAFIDANVGSPLPGDLDDVARHDLRRSAAEAWQAWLSRGSREDWSDVTGLDVPALVIAGDADGALGARVQPHLHGPVYAQASFLSLPGAGHLLPLERPQEIAAAITSFWAGRAGLGPVVPPAAAAVIASARTGGRARAALAGRALADDPGYSPRALSRHQLTVLRALADRVVPQDTPPIDLAARVDARLATGRGDGWRFADLPPDIEAYRRSLDTLAELPTLSAEKRDTLIAELAAGEAGLATVGLGPAALARWFEDACDDLVHAWLAHPASQHRVGYDGYAGGGDGLRLQGFTLMGMGRREAWEPVGGTGGAR